MMILLETLLLILLLLLMGYMNYIVLSLMNNFVTATKIHRLVLGSVLLRFAEVLPTIAVVIPVALFFKTDTVFGILIGSAITNFLVVIPFITTIKNLKLNAESLKRTTLLGLALIITILFIISGRDISPIESLLLCLLFLLYLATSERQKTTELTRPLQETSISKIIKNFFATIVLISIILVMGYLIVNLSENISSGLGISVFTFSVIILGSATSLLSMLFCLSRHALENDNHQEPLQKIYLNTLSAFTIGIPLAQLSSGLIVFNTLLILPYALFLISMVAVHLYLLNSLQKMNTQTALIFLFLFFLFCLLALM